MAVTSVTSALDQIEQALTLWSRPGEHWPQGPIGQQANIPITLADYISRLWELEAAVLDGPPSVHNALRRLHYSRVVRWPHNHQRGIRLDTLLNPNGKKYPLIWSNELPPLSQTTLDALFSAAYLAPPSSASINVPVDLGAIFTATDALFTGGSELAAAAELITGISPKGMVGWAGDLAIWFLRWERRRQEAVKTGQQWNLEQTRQHLGDIQQESAPLELMLGSFDGQALAAYLETAVAGDYDFDATPSIAETLDAYYGESPPAEVTLPHISRRFALFVQAAEPPIPHMVFGAGVLLGSNATEVVAAYIISLATFFLYQGQRNKEFGLAVEADRTRPLGSMSEIADEVVAQAETIQIIADQFVELLQTGLYEGQIPVTWPRKF